MTRRNAWIERELSGHGRALRSLTHAPISGEPFISMSDAREIIRRALLTATPIPDTSAGERETVAAIIDPVAFDPIAVNDTHPSWICRRERALETADKIIAARPPSSAGEREINATALIEHIMTLEGDALDSVLRKIGFDPQQLERDFDHAVFGGESIREPSIVGWSSALAIVECGFDLWKNKPHNAKWFKRIDGTPIPNDLCANIAQAIADAELYTLPPAVAETDRNAPENVGLLHGISSDPPSSAGERMREALEFYADPFAWKQKHDPEDIVRVPDFYSETSFGDTAAEALAALPLQGPSGKTGGEG